MEEAQELRENVALLRRRCFLIYSVLIIGSFKYLKSLEDPKNGSKTKAFSSGNLKNF